MSLSIFTALLGLVAALPHENINVARTAPALTVGMRWDYPLGYTMTAAKANASVPFYSVDLFGTAASDISTMQQQGHYVACYFSAGSREDYRSDANQFPSSAIGNHLDGYPDEEWVDIRNSQVRTIMANRIALAQQKGCNGIDPDNVDGYDNDTGFDLTQQDSIDYVKYLCAQAASRGMKCGQKNALDIVPNLVGTCNWLINEECVDNSECAACKPYINAGKPVFHVEYTEDGTSKQDTCYAQNNPKFSSILKHVALDEYTYQCT